jgi:putative FmdB family regulatory protein
MYETLICHGGYLMLTYEYRCQKCGHHFERTQGIKDAPLKLCPQCGSKVQRV